ncbi:MAG: hypothetical protein IKP40_08415 [Clostridia bacterium]|nr:hypothetical protein [Clostridia bacterium]
MLTITDIMREVKTCFPASRYEGEVRVRDGKLSPELLVQPGDWVAISGSSQLDGVHHLDAQGRLFGAADEVFRGRLTLLRPPEDFIRLCVDILAWEEEHPADGLKAERFGGYERESALSRGGLPMDWRQVFAARLAWFRRMFPEEELTW